VLQFEVLEHRLKHEYGVDLRINQLPFRFARWPVSETDIDKLKQLNLTSSTMLVEDNDSRPVLLFENEFAPLVGRFREACPEIAGYVGLDGPGGPADSGYEDLLAGGRMARPDIMQFDEAAPAELFYTSGSTGHPKGVLLSHRTLYLHAMSVLAAEPHHDDTAVELHTIPLFHANAWGRPHVATMMGQTQVMVRRFDSAAVLCTIQEERATGMSLVPTMAAALLQCPDLGRYDVSTLREIYIGGAASSPELIERMEKAFGCTVMAGYGMTETSPVVTSGRPKGTVTYADAADRARRQAMAGWPLPGIEIRVVDPHGNDIPRDMQTVGEVVVRGDNVMDGYYNDPEASAAVMSAGGWLHTGDMAAWDEDGYIQIVDRKKDIIISGGENISSIEVERAIAAHPAVLECAVVAAPDARWGEVPAAFVVLKPGQRLTREELQEFLTQHLARFKMPREVRFLETPLPKTGTGKIFKRELREQFWKSMARRVQG
jgi:fatty-acyl-CoA synthase